MKDHRLIDERSLAFARLIAAKVAADPTLVARARANLDRWLQSCSHATRPALQEWQAILSGPCEDVVSLLLAADERGARLRQSNPFAGVLTTAERTAILRQFAAHESATT